MDGHFEGNDDGVEMDLTGAPFVCAKIFCLHWPNLLEVATCSAPREGAKFNEIRIEFALDLGLNLGVKREGGRRGGGK